MSTGRAVIVVNPRAGAGSASVDRLSRRLAQRLAGRGIAAHSIALTEPNAGQRPGSDRPDGDRPGAGQPGQDWQQHLAASLAAGAEQVFVLGGDGSVRAVADLLFRLGHNLDRPLGIVPLGTANLLARDLGLPLDPEAALTALLHGVRHPIDCARVNGELFLCASMLGLTTTLAQAREAARGTGLLALGPRLVRKTAAMLRRYPYWEVRLDLDGHPLTLRTRTLLITNNPLQPQPSLYPQRSGLQHGVLGLYGVREGPLWELPRLVLRLLNGTWPEDPRIFRHQVARLQIHGRRGRPISVLNDGERMRLSLPLRYELLPRALCMLAPDASHAERA